MPTYLTEFTRKYQPGEHPAGVATQRFVGPYIVAPNLEKAHEICSALTADPNGDSPLQILGELDEIYPVPDLKSVPDLKGLRAGVAEVMRQVNTLIWGPNGVCDCRHDTHGHAGGKGACKAEHCDCKRVTQEWRRGMSVCKRCGTCSRTENMRGNCCSEPRIEPLHKET